MITNLITAADLKDYKFISDSLKNVTTWPQFVSEAQLFDVKPWLSDALLMEIIGQAATTPQTFSPANTKLLDGGTYTYQSVTYHFQGLKAAIIYYAFARFANRTSVNFTAAGVVIKDSDFSTPATTKDIQRIVTEAQLNADAIRCEIITFLNRNYKSYPLWESYSQCNSRGCHSNRPFTVIGD